MMHARLSITSEKGRLPEQGKGTTVYVELPK